MSYLGTEPRFGTFNVERFSGNGSTTSFTLATPPGSPSSLLVTIDGVKQQASAYNVTDTAIDFGAGNAPATGTNNIEVIHLGSRTLVSTVADDSITTAKIIDDAVTTAKIIDDAVTGAKIANPLNLADGVLQRAEIKDYSETYNASSGSGTVDLDISTGNVFQHTASGGNVTFTFSNPPASGKAGSFTLKWIQDSTDRTITWPASVDWAGATAPTVTSGSAKVDIYVFTTFDAGTTWYGFQSGADLS